MRYEDTSGSLGSAGTPQARDDADKLAQNSNAPATGNVVTGAGTTTGKDGADTPQSAHVISVRGAGGTDSSDSGESLHVAGRYGTLTMDEHGSYRYVPEARHPENVRDLFQYTLANAKGQSTADLVIELGGGAVKVNANAQQVVPGPDGVVTLPAGVDLSDVHVVGRDLVVNLPDGSQIVIVDGAVFVPQLVLGGVEVPSTNLAALLIDSEPKPAAGSPQSGGGNFEVPVPPLDPGTPLGDLIPPVEMNFPPPVVEEIGQFEDKEPEAGSTTALLDDDTQAGNNPLSNVGDDPGTDPATGFLPGSGGDGDLTWALTDVGAAPAGSGLTFELQANGDVWVLQGSDHVITISVDPETGEYTVDQLMAISHEAGGNENNLIFTLNYTVTDQDGDTATGTLTVDVDDDMPTVTVQAGPDEQVVLTTHDALSIPGDGNPDSDQTTADFSGVFGGTSVVFGADGAGPTSSSTYALAVTGSSSGLSSHGAAINLYLINGVVVGSTAASAGAVADGNTIFTVATDNTGIVTLTQFQQIDHPIGQDPTATETPFDDQIISMADHLITLTRSETAVDGDGDSVTGSATIDIGANLHFTDDGPTIDPSLNEVGAAVLDETLPSDDPAITLTGGFTAGNDPDLAGGLAIGKGSTSGAVVDANAAFGADGPAAGGGITYDLVVLNSVSGLTTTDGTAINLVELSNGVVIGVVDGTSTAAFAISIDSSTGVVSVEQYLSLFHPDSTNPDDVDLLAEGSLGVTVTATDFDGDTATSNPVDITSLIQFHDDGPSVSLNAIAEPSLTVDESNFGGDAGPTSFAGMFNFNFGADGPADSDAIQFNLGINAGPTGLVDTLSGEDVVLSVENGEVVGRAGIGGAIVFVISVDGDGNVSLDQQRAVIHADPNDPNDSITFLADNLITLSATVTDGDGDQATIGTPLAIAQDFHFLDDGPTITAEHLTGIVDEDGVPGGIAGGPDDVAGQNTVATGNVSTLFNSGADQPLTYSLLTNTSGLPALTSGGLTVHYAVSGNTLTAYTGATPADGVVFTFTLNATTGAYTFTLVDQLDHPSLDNQAGDNTENDLAIALGSIIQGTDADGDSVTAAANGLVITVDDDTPVAHNDTDTVPSGGTQATGNVITGANTDGGTGGPGADASGADAPATITKIEGTAGSDTTFSGGFLSIGGAHGTLTMDANGNYTYTRTDSVLGTVTDTFTYTLTDADGDSVTATLTISMTDNAPAAGTVNATLDDDALAGGNPGGIGDDSPDTSNLSGTLPGSGGDAPLTFSFGTNVAPAGFTYDTSTPGTLLIKQGGVTVITVTINSSTGAYTITQNNPIDHTAGGDENNISFAIQYVVSDSDAVPDTATGTININVDDDTPTVSANAAVQLDDDALTGGNAGGIGDDANATNTTGTLAHSYGADGAGSIAYLATGAPAGFSYALQGNGDLWVMQGATHVLTLTVNSTTGAYTVTQVAPIDHAAGGDENNQSFTIGYRVTDGDGDTVDGSISINVDDDTPTVSANTAVQLDDDALTGGNPGGTGDVNPDTANTSGTLSHSFGADGAGSIAYLTTGAPSGFSYALQGNGDLWVMQGTTHVLTLTVNSTTGAYTVTQVAPILHAAGGDENDQSFTIGYRVTDGDGDTVDGSITINVDDDTPVNFTPVDLTDTTNATVITQDDALVNDGSATATRLINDPNNDGIGTNFIGADGFGSLVWTAAGHTNGEQLENSIGDPLTSHGDAILVSGFGTNTLTAYADVDGSGTINAGDTVVFTATLNPNGGFGSASTYTITFNDTIDNGSGVTFDDLTSAAAGNLDFRLIGQDDPATTVDLVLSARGADGTSGTINTDSDSIGVDSQAVNPGATVRIDFVSDLTTVPVSGANPQGFDYTAHVDTNLFHEEIPQVQGNPNNTISIVVTAVDADDDFEFDNTPATPEAGESISDITTVTVFDYSNTSTPTLLNSYTFTGTGSQGGYTVTFNPDGSVRIDGLGAHDQYEIQTAAGDPFSAVIVNSPATNPVDFDLGIFSIGTVDSGDPIDLSLGVTATDADGDSATGTIDLTLVPASGSGSLSTLSTDSAQSEQLVSQEALNTTSLFSSTETQKTTTNSNNVLMGAFAAAGLAAEDSLAASPTDSSVQSNGDTLDSLAAHTQALSPIAADAVAGTHASELMDARDVAAQVTVKSAASHASDQGQAHGLTAAGEAHSQQAPTELLQGTQAPAGNGAVHSAATAQTVSLPSAAQLAAAGLENGNASDTAQHNAVVGKVLADALHGGTGEAHGPNLDALINTLPSHGGAADALDALASHAGAAVSNVDTVGMAGFITTHTGLMEQMAAHQASVAPHA